MEILARNVNDALIQGLEYIYAHGQLEPSRNGPVIVAPGPVMTTYINPAERVLFSPVRDANPFFHFFESLWMLAGRNDIAIPATFNKRMMEYSDDGTTQAGAYGFRWRHYFGRDQLDLAIRELRRDPSSRRVVIEMWSQNDLGGTGRDLPCNTHIYLDVRNAMLNMTVCNRSNDILWGAYGANAVHFSMLQEYLALACGYDLGVYRQFSNNYHLYTDILPETKVEVMIADLHCHSLYEIKSVKPYKMMDGLESIIDFGHDLGLLMMALNGNTRPQPYFCDFFKFVAMPMLHAWNYRKVDMDEAANWAHQIAATDWRRACVQWLERRRK